MDPSWVMVILTGVALLAGGVMAHGKLTATQISLESSVKRLERSLTAQMEEFKHVQSDQWNHIGNLRERMAVMEDRQARGNPQLGNHS